MTTHADIDRARALVQCLRGAVAETIVGQDEPIDAALVALLCRGHLLLEGAPGLGKTLLVRALAGALGLRFQRVQCTPDLMPADILGTHVLIDDPAGRRFRFSPGPIFAQVLLVDEVNRATPKTQSALLQAMEEGEVTVGRTTIRLDAPFLVLATQNPIEMEGTYPLPEAQIDRFQLKVLVGRPDQASLVEITRRATEENGLPLPRPIASLGDIQAAQAVVRELPIAEPLRRYAARLVLATRPDGAGAPEAVRSYVEVGASPRGASALILAAKARALFAGAPNVRRADLQAAFRPALQHRVLLNFRGEADGVTVSSLLDEVWKETPLL